MCKKKLKINKTAKSPEIIVAKLLGDCFFNDKTLMVGDDYNLKVPDIYTEDLSIGIEVVQIDTDADLDSKYIWKEMEKNGEDYNATKKFCYDNYHEKYPGKYNLTEKEGKVFCNYAGKFVHNKTRMQDLYCKNIKNKLEKLNKGHYSAIEKETDLCILIIYKTIRKFNADFIAYCYKHMEKKYKKSYNKIYIIESNKTYVIYPSRIKKIEPIFGDKCIIGFNVKGENYIEEMNVCCSNYFENEERSST